MNFLNKKLLILVATLATVSQISAKLTSIKIDSENGQAMAFDQNNKLLAKADQHNEYDLNVGDSTVSFALTGRFPLGFPGNFAAIRSITNQTSGPIYYDHQDYAQSLAVGQAGEIAAGATKTLNPDTHVPWLGSGRLQITLGTKPASFTITSNQ